MSNHREYSEEVTEEEGMLPENNTGEPSEDEENVNEELEATMYALYARYADEKQADDDKEIRKEVKNEDKNEHKQLKKGEWNEKKQGQEIQTFSKKSQRAEKMDWILNKNTTADIFITKHRIYGPGSKMWSRDNHAQ